MKKLLSEEFQRMQRLAGIIKELQSNEISNNDKALGILFHPNKDKSGYEWDMDAFNNLVKDMGYTDYKEVAGEFTHYFSPSDEDEIKIFRNRLDNPNLQPEDLTIGMYKQAIEQEFPEKQIKESQLNEEQYAEPIIMIQNIVDNWTDDGIDAESAMIRINKILQGNYEDESGEGFIDE